MSDYDKQFKEDLERAQALSLESLALEEFRNKRLQELNRSATSVSNNKPKIASVTRAASMNETDSVQTKYERQLSKSRPRPGTSGSPAPNPLIAPPPQNQRRSSVANDVEDLISFASPPPITSAASDIIDFCNQQSYSNNQVALITAPTMHQQHHQFKYWPQLPVQQPLTPMFHANIQQQQQGMMYRQQMANGGFYRPIMVQSPVVDVSQIGFRPSIVQGAGTQSNNTGSAYGGSTKSRHSPTSPPALPPKNQTRQPPPPPKSKAKLTVITSRDRVDNCTGNSHNLIDLAQTDDKNSVRVSILQEFDPILSNSQYSARTISPDCSGDDTLSVCESVYDEYYDYDFIYSGSGNNSLSGTNSVSDPIYATINRNLESNPVSPSPPVPPRARMSTIDRKTSKNLQKNLLDDVVQNDSRAVSKHPDLKAFYNMVYRVRTSYKYNDPDTNMGLVISPMVNYKYNEDLSIKLRVYPDFAGADFSKPISFTCDVNSSVEHITMQLTYDLEAPTHQNYTLKVWGFNEYLVPTTFLSDYEYVHTCIKLDEDVVLILIPDAKKDKSFARTMQDDNRDNELTFEKVVPSEMLLHITYDSLKILLETVESEMKKLEEAAVKIEQNNNLSVMPALQPLNVIQSIKCIINLMGDLCTLDIMQTVDDLIMLCNDFIPSSNMGFSKIVRNCCNKIRFAVQTLIEMYCQAFTVNFEVNNIVSSEPTKYADEIQDSVVLRVCAIYRPCSKWEHDFYCISAHIYHGTRKIGRTVSTAPFKKVERDKLWPSRIIFDCWLDFDDIPICNLARECRLVLQLYGRTLDTTNNSEEDKKNAMPVFNEEELGWAAVQFFDYEGVMVQGSILLSIWPIEPTHINDHVYGPAPAMGTHPQSDHPMVGIEIVAPPKTQFRFLGRESIKNVIKGDFYSLDNETQQLLIDACDQDLLYKFQPEIREILWEKRHYLYHIPKALPKVLLAAHSWAYVCLPDLHGMLRSWKKLEPIEALQLLLPVYPDIEVRKTAIQWICHMSNDELVDYLPQMVVALRYETYESSAMAEFLLRKALCSPRFAHYFFWLLSHSLPGSNPQNGTVETSRERDDSSISEVRYHKRSRLLLRALLAICGESLRKCFLSQQLLVKQLNDAAENLKNSKDSQKLQNLYRDLETVKSYLNDNPTSLPLSPTLKVNGIDVKSCSYFASNTLPLKINFIMEDSSLYPAIHKVGDDLQQDMLTLQLIRLMDKLWLFDGLDLKMVTFNCIPTSKKKGMIEMVTKSETLRKIQVEHGLTGSFKDKPIAEWLAKHNPSELEYARAIQNFTASCAGYCVVTYILGICDRHNDNIMLKTSGHLFHIDFGKFLGDAQMFGNFKRDRAPFVLTSDMAYVINGGDRPTEKFHHFVDLCCQAFNIIRNNRNLFLFLMTSSGICSITPESIGYMHRALLPEQSNPEAAAYFTRLIEESLKTKFTQFNFFLHNLAQNLAQLKFTGENNAGSLLSFVPKTYSMETDGRLTLVEVATYRKRYDPDKYYVYILRVYREGQNQPMEIQRTYKEFCELHQKLCIYFPLAKLYSLSTGLHMGRQNIKQVAQKRFNEISLFVKSLFLCAVEIAHSDLVYTFFHPLLRDQKEDEYSKKARNKLDTNKDSGRLKGQLKLSLIYSKGVFTVMVHHARGLPRLNGQEPSTYVKVYLEPDLQKSTKRKTKVVKKNCHPSFMEMLEYRMALDIVKFRTLKATVWNYDPLQENEFMGGVELELTTLDLTVETSEWYPLINLSR